MKRRHIILSIVLAVLLGGVGVFVWAVDKVVKSRTGPEIVYQLDNRPEFLTEALAMELAQKTLLTDRGGTRKWEPRSRDDRSKAIDGREDIFLNRNTVNYNRGYIIFHEGDSERIVDVELKGDVVVCRISLPK
ncbi:MAG: hypothetical protein QM703_16180 [Gemmatales bacterium]